MTHLDKDALQDIMNQNLQGTLPILLKVYNPDIFWTEEEKAAYQQKDGQINLISDNAKVIYKGETWLPCAFSFVPPPKDSSKQGTASVSIMAVDERVSSLLQMIKISSEIQAVAAYCKQDVKKEDGSFKTIYKFMEINSYKLYINSASISDTTATFNLSYMDNLQYKVPADIALAIRIPSGAV